MNLADLFIAKKLAGGGGGGTGTDNYNDLSNKPQINSTALTGDKSASDLGLQSEIDSDNKISADYVDDTSASNKFVSAAEKLEWSGKQDAIDADHKIDADYVDDTTSDNKFVTASDKTAWNAKQNAIDSSHKLSSDLVDDTGHTNLFVTSTEKSTWNGKQDKIDSSHKLSSTLVSFDSSEAAALASGIDSSKVEQISTNQTNILYTIPNCGGQNIVQLKEESAIKAAAGNLTVSVSDDKIITISGSDTSTKFIDAATLTAPKTGYYYFTSEDGSDSTCAPYIKIGNNYYWAGASDVNPGKHIELTAGTTYTVTIRYTANTTGTYHFKLMVRDAAITDMIYQPYALPNYDLTRLEAEDRAALAEEIDAGAKNMLNFDLTSLKALNTSGTWSGNSYTKNGVTFTYNDSTKTISTYGTSTAGNTIFYLMNFTPTSGKSFTISGCPSGGSSSGYRFCNMGQTWANDFGSSSTAVGDGASKEMAIYIQNSGTTVGTSSNPLTWKLMICTKAAFGVSSKFVPYRPNYDLVCDKIPAANYKRYACTEANAYQKVSDLTFSIASRSTKFVSVRHVFSNAQPQGIAICISGHTPSESGYTVLKSEDTSIQCTSGLIINGGNSVVNYDVYVKQATANTNGNDVVVYRSADYAF